MTVRERRIWMADIFVSIFASTAEPMAAINTRSLSEMVLELHTQR